MKRYWIVENTGFKSEGMREGDVELGCLCYDATPDRIEQLQQMKPRDPIAMVGLQCTNADSSVKVLYVGTVKYVTDSKSASYTSILYITADKWKQVDLNMDGTDVPWHWDNIHGPYKYDLADHAPDHQWIETMFCIDR